MPARSTARILACGGCRTRYPRLDGIACLVHDPGETCRRFLRRFDELAAEGRAQLDTIAHELARDDLMTSTAARLRAFAEGVSATAECVAGLRGRWGLEDGERG